MQVSRCSACPVITIGRPAITEFAPDGVAVDLRVYGCWKNGGLCYFSVVFAFENDMLFPCLV